MNTPIAFTDDEIVLLNERVQYGHDGITIGERATCREAMAKLSRAAELILSERRADGKSDI